MTDATTILTLTVMLMGHQSQMAFATRSIDGVALRNNVALIAKAAGELSVATILTTVVGDHAQLASSNGG